MDIGAANETVDNKGVGNNSVGSSDISGHEAAMSRFIPGGNIRVHSQQEWAQPRP